MRIRVVIALLLLTVFPVAADAQKATPAADAVRVTLRQGVDLDSGAVLALSPDGTEVAIERRADAGRSFCVLEAATFADIACAPFPNGQIAPKSVVWSPDGTRIAFTEDALRPGHDSDIWIFDVATSAVTDLTDDGYSGSWQRRPDGTPIDLAPDFSPDGKEIVFARSVSSGTDTTALAIVPVAGGQPRTLVTVAPEMFDVVEGVRWGRDGAILYSINALADNANNGIWSIPAAGGEPRQLLTERAAGIANPIVAGLAPNGRILLVTDRIDSAQYALFDPADGQTTPVQYGAGRGSSFFYGVALSPDGSRLLMSSDDLGLTVKEIATGQERPLAPPDRVEGRQLKGYVGLPYSRNGLTWAANDVIFGVGPANSGILLYLDLG